MGYGRVTPDGHLPVFSVDTEEEAQKLIIGACQRGDDGKFYARELLEEQTLPNLYAFGEKVASVHDRLVALGKCECKDLKKD